MWSVGLDIHWRWFAICILDSNGKVIKETRQKGSWGVVMEVLSKIPHEFAICYEASCGYGAIYDRLVQIARRVAVAHPGQLRMIFRSKRKNDRVDARKLALLLLLGQVPEVHVPSVDVRSWRSAISFRNRLIGKRTGIKNAVRALLRGHGIEMPAGTRLWTKKGRAWLAGVSLPTDLAGIQRDAMVDELRQMDEHIQRTTAVLNKIGNRHPGVRLLRTIPGVGPRTAEAVVAYIDQPKRFRSNKQIGAYFGLVPCQDQSADRNRLGHITGDGPVVVRRLLTEATWQGIRRCGHLKAYFERIRNGDPDRGKIALVATCHYLARVMLAMLQSGEPCRFVA